MTQSKLKIIDRFSDVAGEYSACLCDVWGVVHNGKAPFPHAVDALTRFRQERGPVLLLTNAPRPAESVAQQFEVLGVSPDAWDGILTSGDVTSNLLHLKKGQKVYHLGPERDRPLLDGHELEPVDLEAADFILCSGLFDDTTETPDDYRASLTEAASAALPMICANPDRIVKRGDDIIYCAGALAELYGELGGKVDFAGKPYKPVYELAMSRLNEMNGKSFKHEEVLAVGDGPATDIKGGKDFGLDVLYVAAGIHAEDSFGSDGRLSKNAIRQLLGDVPLPEYGIADLVW